LAALTATVGGKLYKAKHEARNRHASSERLEMEKEVARSDGGKFATWQRQSRPSNSISDKIRGYYTDIGFPDIADPILEVSKKSDETLVKEFVMLSRVAAAASRTGSGEKFINRLNTGKMENNGVNVRDDQTILRLALSYNIQPIPESLNIALIGY
jgi:hypothetical protein